MNFTRAGATLATISLPKGSFRFGVFSCNLQLTSRELVWPRITLDGTYSQASFTMAGDDQVPVAIPFSVIDSGLTSVNVRGWNTPTVQTFEQTSWWCVGINW